MKKRGRRLAGGLELCSHHSLDWHENSPDWLRFFCIFSKLTPRAVLNSQ
jgi:hypothetical protein